MYVDRGRRPPYGRATVHPLIGLLVVSLLWTGCGATGSSPAIPVESGPASPGGVTLPSPGSTQAEPQQSVEAAPAEPYVALPGGPDRDKLPAALPTTAGQSPDDRAAALAAAVLKGGDQALPALLAALAESGIAVKDIDSTLARPAAEPAQGLSLMAGEAILLAEMEQTGDRLPFEALGGVVSTLAFQTDDDQAPSAISAYFTDKLAEATASDVPTYRFWGRFITELELQGPARQKLEGFSDMPMWIPLRDASEEPPQYEGPTVDAVQATLLLLRLAGDLQLEATAPLGSLPAALLVSYVRPQQPAARPVQVPAAGPCDLGKVPTAIEEAVKFGLSQTTARTVQQYINNGPLTERNKNAFRAANAALALFKYMISQAMFKRKAWTDPDVLIRTTDTHPGKINFTNPPSTIQISAQGWIDLEGLQYLNCARFVAYIGGFSGALPKNGPLAGFDVYWDDNPTGHWAGPVAMGGPGGWFGDFAPISKKPASLVCGNMCRTKSNAEGIATIPMVGNPYACELKEPLGYRFPTDLNVAAKYSKPADAFAALEKALFAAAGLALSGITMGASLAALVPMALETLEQIGSKYVWLQIRYRDYSKSNEPDAAGGVGSGKCWGTECPVVQPWEVPPAECPAP